MNNKKNKEIIEKLYKEILLREPDEEGLNHYLNMLKEGKINDEELKKIFFESEEFKRIQLTFKHDKVSYKFKGKYDIIYQVDPSSILDHNIVENGVWDEYNIILLQKHIPKNGVIFDIGANVGLATLPFAKVLVPQGKVYSFEPNSAIRKKLLSNTEINNFSNIFVKSFALQENSDIEKSELRIRRAIHDDGKINDGISTLEEFTDYIIGKEIVEITTVDNFIRKNNIPRVDFLKIDVEGSDSRVLQGSNNTIDKFHPIIMYESSPKLDKENNRKNSQKCFEYIRSKGYEQYRISNENLIKLSDFESGLPLCDIVCFFKKIN